MGVHPDGGDQQSTAPAKRGDDASLARPSMLEPTAPQRGARAEKHEKQRVHPTENRLVPIASGGEQLLQPRHVGRAWDGLIDAKRFGERQPEHRKPVGHADAQMNAQGCWGHEPAVESGARDDALLCQEVFHVLVSPFFECSPIDWYFQVRLGRRAIIPEPAASGKTPLRCAAAGLLLWLAQRLALFRILKDHITMGTSVTAVILAGGRGRRM